jgi:hypothetical protein
MPVARVFRIRVPPRLAGCRMRSEASCHTSGIERNASTVAAGSWPASPPPCIPRCTPMRLDDQGTRNRTRYRARHSRSADSARPYEIPHTPPPAGHTGIRCRGTPADTAGRNRHNRSRRERLASDSSAEIYLIVDRVREIRSWRLNACPSPFAGLANGGGGDCFHRLPSIRSSRCVAARPSSCQCRGHWQKTVLP